MEEIKEYATMMICSGYQKNTTRNQQQAASIFSILYTQIVEYEKYENQPSAVYDFKSFLEGKGTGRQTIIIEFSR